jgi:hypothetical protein
VRSLITEMRMQRTVNPLAARSTDIPIGVRFA